MKSKNGRRIQSASILQRSLIFSVLVLVVLGILVSSTGAHSGHMNTGSQNEDNEQTTETEGLHIPCTSDPDCQNETEGLGPLSFCDLTSNRICKCKPEIREIPIRRHHDLCVIPVEIGELCLNDHECGAGTNGSTCVTPKGSNDSSAVCQCAKTFVYSRSTKSCIPRDVPTPSPYRWWWVLVILGYPTTTIVISVTRKRIVRWFRRKILRKPKRRRQSATDTDTVNISSSDDESVVEMQLMH